MSRIIRSAMLAVGLMFSATSTKANVITDWDATAVSVTPPSAAGLHEMAIMHVAMFDAVNSIARRYRPYMVQPTASKATSQEAAATAAAAGVLIGLHPEAAERIKAASVSALAAIPEGEAKADALALGQAVADKILSARSKDGANAPDDYRPKTKPGVYVPTAAVMAGSTWPRVPPFALKSPSQFRPAPPISLSGTEWAADYNEIRELGGKNSAKRSAQQTETARFWLALGPPVYHQIPRQLVAAKQMSVVESAKYHYEFWRPVTAIRNGDIDDNPATEREATWQPLDSTPMHPEYPCAHCIQSGAAAAVIEAVLGSQEIPEVTMTSTTAPGVTHRWTNTAARGEGGRPLGDPKEERRDDKDRVRDWP